MAHETVVENPGDVFPDRRQGDRRAPATPVEATLNGCPNCFAKQSVIAQELKHVVLAQRSTTSLRAPQREALEIVIHRLAAILNGGADEPEHWRVISAYTGTVENWLNHTPKNCPACSAEIPEENML